MFTKLFLKDTAERAIATFAQTVVAMVGVLAPMSDMSLLDINYAPVLLVGLVAAGLSVLKALAARKVGDEDSASLVKEV